MPGSPGNSGIKFEPFSAQLIPPPGGAFQRQPIPTETPDLAEPGDLQPPGAVPEVVTEERILGLCRLALVTVPEGFSKPWLATPDEQLKPFATELCIYCNRHGIDPSEYVGDFFPLIITGMPIAFGIVHRHKEHKKETTTAEKQRRSGTRKAEEPEEPEEAEKTETEEETET